jgi:ribosomal-protein-alanine N-acetyltransferase
MTATDGQVIFQLRSDKTVSHFIDRPLQKDISEARDFITYINDGIKEKKYLYWAITLKESPELIGTICLWNFLEDGTAEMGYELLPSAQGKGIMGEAMKVVIGYGLNALGLKKIEAFTHKDNAGSLKLLEKNGFEHEVGRVDKAMPDNVIYVLRK